VAIFALGPTHTDEQELQGAREQFDKEKQKFPWLAPVALQVFGGKYDPARLRFPDSLLAKLPASPLYNAPASDGAGLDRDPRLAKDLAARFQPALPK